MFTLINPVSPVNYAYIQICVAPGPDGLMVRFLAD